MQSMRFCLLAALCFNALQAQGADWPLTPIPQDATPVLSHLEPYGKSKFSVIALSKGQVVVSEFNVTQTLATWTTSNEIELALDPRGDFMPTYYYFKVKLTHEEYQKMVPYLGYRVRAAIRVEDNFDDRSMSFTYPVSLVGMEILSTKNPTPDQVKQFAQGTRVLLEGQITHIDPEPGYDVLDRPPRFLSLVTAVGQTIVGRLDDAQPYYKGTPDPKLETLVDSSRYPQVGDTVRFQSRIGQSPDGKNEVAINFQDPSVLLFPNADGKKTVDDRHAQESKALANLETAISSTDYAGARLASGAFMKVPSSSDEKARHRELLARIPVGERPVVLDRMYANEMNAGFKLDFDSMTTEQVLDVARRVAKRELTGDTKEHSSSDSYLVAMITRPDFNPDEAAECLITAVQTREALELKLANQPKPAEADFDTTYLIECAQRALTQIPTPKALGAYFDSISSALAIAAAGKYTGDARTVNLNLDYIYQKMLKSHPELFSVWKARLPQLKKMKQLLRALRAGAIDNYAAGVFGGELSELEAIYDEVDDADVNQPPKPRREF